MAVGSSFATRWRFLAVVCLSLGFALQVDAVDVYTPSELFVENGTKARLPCTFKSSEVVSSKASVSWNFMGDGKNPSAILYYLSGQSYPGSDPLFKDRVTWAGDFNKKDASIYIENVQFRDNGTYTCDVKNPPDIAGLPGTIVLRVVAKEHLPVFTPGVVAGIAIGSVAAFLLLVALIVFVVCMTVNSEKDYSGTAESLMPPVKQIPKKSSPDTQGLVKSIPTGSHQGPIIYAQLDHSGGQASDQIIKSESVVYADIRKN